MSHKIVKKNDEFGVIAGILDCYMILRLQNSSYSWSKIPFMSSLNGSETVEIEDAHFINENTRPTEIVDKPETKKTKIYTISRPGLFNKVLTTLFKSIFVDFMNKCTSTTTVEDVSSKIIKRKNLLYKFMDDEILGSDAFSAELWSSLEQINLHKLETIVAVIKSYAETKEGSQLKGFIISTSMDILYEYGNALLRFIYMLSGFLLIRYNVDMKTIKADTLITTIKTLHFLGIININWNRPSNHNMDLILSDQLDILLKEEIANRAKLQKKKDENKRAKELESTRTPENTCEIEHLLQDKQSKPMRSIDSEDEEESEQEFVSPPKHVKKSTISKSTSIPTNKSKQLQKLKIINPQMEDVPDLTNFSYINIDDNQIQTTSSSLQNQVVKKVSVSDVKDTKTTLEVKSKKTKTLKEDKLEPTINLGDNIEDIDSLLAIEDTIKSESKIQKNVYDDDESLEGDVNQIDDDDDEDE